MDMALVQSGPKRTIFDAALQSIKDTQYAFHFKISLHFLNNFAFLLGMKYPLRPKD
jgi:hypothetical protein